MNERIGGAFLVVDEDDAAQIRKRVLSAMVEVPEGRCLFVLWKVEHLWGSSVPVESTVVQSVLGSPSDRNISGWLFYGTGAVRTYDSDNFELQSTWMWVGCRREGDKAYRRKNFETIDDVTMVSSSIPVSHKVFTRDVANNLWHLREQDCLPRIIRRIQSLTSWSDEVIFVHFNDRMEKWDHAALNCDDDLIPVAEKIKYECEGIELSVPGKQKIKKTGSQSTLF